MGTAALTCKWCQEQIRQIPGGWRHDRGEGEAWTYCRCRCSACEEWNRIYRETRSVDMAGAVWINKVGPGCVDGMEAEP